MMEGLPDWVLPMSQKTGAGDLVRGSLRFALRPGGQSSPLLNVRFSVPHKGLIGISERNWTEQGGLLADQGSNGTRSVPVTPPHLGLAPLGRGAIRSVHSSRELRFHR